MQKVAQVSLISSKVWLRYKKTIIPNKLNHKPPAIQGMCEENKKEKELEEKQLPVKIFHS